MVYSGGGVPVYKSNLFFLSVQNDVKMQEIIKYTHMFLQKFCMGNQENQALLHKNLNLFLNPGVTFSITTQIISILADCDGSISICS